MNVIEKQIGEIFPYENNPRNNESAVDAVAESIKQFGFKQPIVVDKDNVIIVGHTRWEAAQRLGLESVPVLVAEDLTEQQAKAYRLADNKTNELSGWDFLALDEELDGILDFDMTDFGFDDEEPEPIEVTEDEYDAEEPAEARTKSGDLWQLGKHRLICGDSTDAETAARLMGDARAKILFTSPPYSDMREYNGDKDLSVANLARFIETFKEYAEYQCVNLGIQRKDHEIVQYWDEYITQAKACGYKLMAWNVWDKKTVGAVGQQSALFPIRHEFIFVFGSDFFDINRTVRKQDASIHANKRRAVRQVDGGMKTTNTGDMSNKYKQMESVQTIVSEHGSIRKLHPATFPIDLPAAYIQSMTDEEDAVIDPFGGSGTTMIACEQLDRVCYMCELDPKYCDVIIDRWETFTGEKAVLINA